MAFQVVSANCGPEITTRLQNADKSDDELIAVLAMFGPPLTDASCKVAVLGLMAGRVTQSSSAYLRAAFISCAARNCAVLDPSARARMLELCRAADLSDPLLLIAISDGLREARLDLRAELSSRLPANAPIMANAVDDPLLAWFYYAMSFGDSAAEEALSFDR